MAISTLRHNGKVMGRFNRVTGMSGRGVERGGSIVDEARRAFREAENQNEMRYRRILEGYKKRREDVMGEMEDMGTQAREDIRERGRKTKGEVTQKMISRGMGSTTVLPAMRSGVDERTQDSIGRLDAQIGQQRASTLSGLSGATLGFMERRQDQYPNISQLAQEVRQKGETDRTAEIPVPDAPSLEDRPIAPTQPTQPDRGTSPDQQRRRSESEEQNQQRIEAEEQVMSEYPDYWQHAINRLKNQGRTVNAQSVRATARRMREEARGGSTSGGGASGVSGGSWQLYGQRVGEFIYDNATSIQAPSSIEDTAGKLANGKSVSQKKFSEMADWYNQNKGRQASADEPSQEPTPPPANQKPEEPALSNAMQQRSEQIGQRVLNMPRDAYEAGDEMRHMAEDAVRGNLNESEIRWLEDWYEWARGDTEYNQAEQLGRRVYLHTGRYPTAPDWVKQRAFDLSRGKSMPPGKIEELRKWYEKQRS